MYEYATQFAPMYSRTAPSDYDSVNVPLKILNGTYLGTNAYLVEAIELKRAIWTGYSNAMNLQGVDLASRLKKLGSSGLASSLIGTRISRGKTYNRTPINTAFNVSAFAILRIASEKIGAGKTALVFNYGLLVFDTSEKTATNALADAVAEVCGVPVEITCRRFQK